MSLNFYIKLSMQNVNNANAFDLKCLSLNVRGLNKSIKRRSTGTNHSKGVITLINPSVDFKVEKCIPDKQGRFIILKVVIDGKAFVLVTDIYAPNDVAQQTTFFNKLSKQLEEFTQDTIIIGGDFNCA